QQVTPFMLVYVTPLAERVFNVVGLRRLGFTPDSNAAVKQMHKLLYRQGLTLEQSRSGIEALASDMPEAAPEVDMMTRFLASATRGIAR
ncbi:MAG: acyl-[acyl-carrier-protein]--UDP-N-acetylglucosamine O-acyltransferase, partial [Hydrogenophaga sp.]|nr:acyl-[acyl-carrier-protein]--UDP-N-acetylglucosamine O-acyltransferase [Hydrogenophaga sp.]